MIPLRTDDAKNRGEAIAADDADEQALLERLAQGDKMAFWVIWMRYRQEFYAHCLSWMGGDREEAEDALSSASLRALKYLAVHAPNIVNIKAWLLRLLYNHCMSIRRAAKRRDQLLQKADAFAEPGPEWRDTAGKSPEEIVSRREMLLGIRRAIGDLPPRLHQTVELRLLRDLSYREIAVRLNVSPANARKRVQQGRLMLQTLLVGGRAAS